ncbi:MAG: hypothetical protein R3E50_17245 [Halioglobus sp.]
MIFSTLSVIGAQVLFFLLILDPGSGGWISCPDFSATMLPVCILFVCRCGPLHVRLQQSKRRELAKINLKLAQLRPQSLTELDDAQRLDEINRLLLTAAK